MGSIGRRDCAVSVASIGAFASSRLLIEEVYPSIEGGRFPVKRICGEAVEIWADIVRDGHNVLAAELIWRPEREPKWRHVPFRLHENDRWTGRFTPPQPGRYLYAIEAWTDVFATWRRNTLIKRDAGLDIKLEAIEGRALLACLKPRAAADARVIKEACREWDSTADISALLSDDVAAAASKGLQSDLIRSAVFPLYADRPRARAGAWYEMVPRSQGRVPGRHGTFDDCIERLPEIAALGFDIVYLTPIHPIGRIHRKGRNNALQAAPGDPGSPYAIGSAEGGNDADHPELGTLEDFRRFVAACRDNGLELALDFAIQCSPDHPWLEQHPEWFRWLPDGTIQHSGVITGV